MDGNSAAVLVGQQDVACHGIIFADVLIAIAYLGRRQYLLTAVEDAGSRIAVRFFCIDGP